MNLPMTDRRVRQRIGRNLLVFQQIELILKRVIPFMRVPSGRAKSVAEIKKLQRDVKGLSLGLVMQRFAAASKSISPAFSSELEALVTARNELVHHLIILPGMLAANSSEQAINYLDKQYEAAMHVNRLVREMYRVVEDAILDGKETTVHVHVVSGE